MDYKIYDFGSGSGCAEITVGVSLHNYGNFILETLESVAQQTFQKLALVVVDDGSIDYGPELAISWMRQHRKRFVRSTMVIRELNKGLAAARNLAVELSISPFYFVLDADNILYPRCLERLRLALKSDKNAAMAYPILEVFGDECGLMGTAVWSAQRFKSGNYIDAMCLLRTKRLLEAGGYTKMKITGWEDYDLWCKFVERGWYGIRVPETLARYRVHGESMLATITRQKQNSDKLVREMKKRHPWLRL